MYINDNDKKKIMRRPTLSQRKRCVSEVAVMVVVVGYKCFGKCGWLGCSFILFRVQRATTYNRPRIPDFTFEYKDAMPTS